jgi:SNF2 family DNA or RNA helicase
LCHHFAGIDFQFSHNIEEEKKKRESNRALSRALHSTSQSSNDNNMIDLDELDEDHVVDDESQPTPRKHKKGDGGCKYSRELIDGKCTICREEHFDCNFMNNEERCYTCFKYAENVPEYASKARYVCEKLIQWRTMNAPISPAAVRFFAKHEDPKSVRHRPIKAIVFSQFRSIYEYFGNHLIRRFGGASIADYSYGGTRSQELAKFIHDPACFAMLLSKQGSLGLDLSFVTHIILLDTIYDQSLFSQVVARAYRMGAKGPVFVEQLTAEDTIEEVMLQMKNKSHNTDETEEKHAKLHFLLKNCMLVKPKQSKLQMNARKKRNAHDMDSEGEGQRRQQRTVRFKD